MKILYVTTIGITMYFFNSFIKNLLDAGHTVDIATNEHTSPLPACYSEWNCNIYHLDTSRSPLSKGNLAAIKQIKKLVKDNGYDIVHCHTPIAAMCTRLACRSMRKQGTKVFYTAHGFHFYKGSPKLNWLLYYPIEKLCAPFTDKLITINKEDYALAKNKFSAKEICYVPGVGIDLSSFENVCSNENAKRREIGITEDDFLLLSVGELNENKNHSIIIKALAKLANPSVHYAIAGLGDKQNQLLELTSSLGVEKQVHLLGYRKDIPELNFSADVFCFPSFREGLPVSMMEAMASGLPIVCSRIRGNTDLIKDGEGGFLCAPDDVDGFKNAIEKLLADSSLREKMGAVNKEAVKKYDISAVLEEMRIIYDI